MSCNTERIPRGRGRPRKSNPKRPRPGTDLGGSTSLCYVTHKQPAAKFDAETKTVIRKHAMLSVRRKQRKEKSLAEKSEGSKLGTGEIMLTVSSGGWTLALDEDDYKRASSDIIISTDLAISDESQYSQPWDPGLEISYNALHFLPKLPKLVGSDSKASQLLGHMSHLFPKNVLSMLQPKDMTDDVVFMSQLFMTQWYLDALRNRSRSMEAHAIGAEAVRALNKRLSTTEAPSSHTYFAIIMYATASRWYSRNLQEYMCHRKGIDTLLSLNGGLAALRSTALDRGARRLLLWHFHIMAALTNGTMPVDTDAQVEHQRDVVEYPPETIQDMESPISCPDQGFTTIPKSKRCQTHTLRLLEDVRSFVQQIIEDSESEGNISIAKLTRRSDLEAHILDLPSAWRQNLPTSEDWIYECCRLAAIVMIGAALRSSSLHTEAVRSGLVAHAQRALRMADTDDLWGQMSGVLFWVVWVFHVRDVDVADQSASDTTNFAWLTALQLRLQMHAMYARSQWACTLPVATIIRFQSACLSGVARLDRERV